MEHKTTSRGSADTLSLIVGLGASAGGLEAYRSFFSNMPPDTGLSFVLVQHLDPNHDSALVNILQGYTGMTVVQASDGMPVTPNGVFVIPRNAILTIEGGVLRVKCPAPPEERRSSVDAFLVSLAEDQKENAVAIIMSGYGSDGTLGIAAVKEHGGLTLSEADFDRQAKSGMPQSAVSGGFVDHVLPARDMPAALIYYRQHRAAFDAGTHWRRVRRTLST